VFTRGGRKALSSSLLPPNPLSSAMRGGDRKFTRLLNGKSISDPVCFVNSSEI
jgi:hypothetical protein